MFPSSLRRPSRPGRHLYTSVIIEGEADSGGWGIRDPGVQRLGPRDPYNHCFIPPLVPRGISGPIPYSSLLAPKVYHTREILRVVSEDGDSHRGGGIISTLGLRFRGRTNLYKVS